jgi:pyruvate formate lyase activating enzyme
VEFTHDTAKLCHDRDVKTVYVTNGYATPEHMDVMKGLLDAYRVDIKAFTDEFYRKTCKSKLEPVLTSTKIAKDAGMHVEVITLIIPRLNDSEDEIRGLSKWIFDNLGPDTPVHFTRFYPMYHMDHEAPTPIATLEKAHDIARNEGINYVYLGNAPGHRYESTWCPKCDELLIERYGFQITKYNITKDKKCPKCGEKIPIVGDYGRQDARASCGSVFVIDPGFREGQWLLQPVIDGYSTLRAGLAMDGHRRDRRLSNFAPIRLTRKTRVFHAQLYYPLRRLAML